MPELNNYLEQLKTEGYGLKWEKDLFEPQHIRLELRKDWHRLCVTVRNDIMTEAQIIEYIENMKNMMEMLSKEEEEDEI